MAGNTALIYLGRRISYAEMLDEVDRCAAAFTAHGIGPGDSVTLSLPSVPNAVIMFYALNRIGARAVMTHPLSSPTELEHYVRESGSRWAVTVDMFYGRFREALANTDVERLVIAAVPDYLSRAKRLGFNITCGRRIDPVPEARPADPHVGRLHEGRSGTEAVRAPRRDRRARCRAVLRRHQRPAEGHRTVLGQLQRARRVDAGHHRAHRGESVLAIRPVFHGFGLGLCVHTPLTVGGHSILVPNSAPPSTSTTSSGTTRATSRACRRCSRRCWRTRSSLASGSRPSAGPAAAATR